MSPPDYIERHALDAWVAIQAFAEHAERSFDLSPRDGVEAAAEGAVHALEYPSVLIDLALSLMLYVHRYRPGEMPTLVSPYAPGAMLQADLLLRPSIPTDEEGSTFDEIVAMARQLFTEHLASGNGGH